MNTTQMTDTQKIEALTDLLSDVLHTLSLKSFEIDDPTESHKCDVESDNYHQQMLDILHSN